MMSRLAALLVAATLLSASPLAASDDLATDLDKLIDRAERNHAADPAFLNDLRDLTGNTYSSAAKEPDVQELQRLIRRAERTHAAQPSFIKELEELTQQYDHGGYEGSTYSSSDQSNEVVIEDDFSDGDFTHNPHWIASSGDFRVEQGGLHSAVREQYASTQENPGTAIAGALLGALTGAQQTQGKYAAIHTEAAIPNTFTVQISLNGSQHGRFDFGPYQGDSAAGYRLAYTPGEKPALQLVRISDSGASVIESYNGSLSRDVDLEWARDENGRMTVSAGGKRLIEAKDQSFRDDFDGFVMINGGGDFTVQHIAIRGGAG
jgi:hypothetical protein